MNLKEILNWRYSTKKFDKSKVLSNEQITNLLEITNLSASSYGLQAFKMVIVKNKEVKKMLVASSYGQTNIADSSHLIVFAARTDVDENFIDDYITNISEQRNVTKESLEGFKQMLINSFKHKDEDALLKWVSNQIYIALGTFLITCASEQIDACPIGGFIPEEYDKELGLVKHNLKSIVVAIVVAAIGYRSEDDKYQHKAKVRSPLNDMIIEL